MGTAAGGFELTNDRMPEPDRKLSALVSVQGRRCGEMPVRRPWLALAVLTTGAFLAVVGMAGCTARTGPTAPVASTTRTRIPSLEVVLASDVAGSRPIRPGMNLKAGHRALMTGQAAVSVVETTAPPGFPAHVFVITLDATGTAAWSRLTSQNVGDQVVFAIDGEVIEAPVIATPIADGQITLEVEDSVVAARIRAAECAE